MVSKGAKYGVVQSGTHRGRRFFEIGGQTTLLGSGGGGSGGPGPELSAQDLKVRATANAERRAQPGIPGRFTGYVSGRERIQQAQLLRAARKRIAAGPKPIRAVSERQQRFAEDIRSRRIESIRRGLETPRRKLLPSQKLARNESIIRLARTYGQTNARQIIDSR